MLFETPQWLKKLRSNNKKIELNLGEENFPLLDNNLHLLTFINWSYPLSDIMDAVSDSASTWFSEHAVNPLGMEWRRRKSYPILLKVPNTDLMLPLLDEPIHKTVSKIGEDPIAICMGPLWNSQIMCYNGYERYR